MTSSAAVPSKPVKRTRWAFLILGFFANSETFTVNSCAAVTAAAARRSFADDGSCNIVGSLTGGGENNIIGNSYRWLSWRNSSCKQQQLHSRFRFDGLGNHLKFWNLIGNSFNPPLLRSHNVYKNFWTEIFGFRLWRERGGIYIAIYLNHVVSCF